MSLFKRHYPFITHQPGQKISRIGATSEELSVGPTVRHTWYRVRRARHHFRHELGVGTLVRAEKLDIQIPLE